MGCDFSDIAVLSTRSKKLLGTTGIATRSKGIATRTLLVAICY